MTNVRFRWLRSLVPAVLGLIGLVFLGYGIVALSTQGWAHATGTVGVCRSIASGSGSSRGVHQSCAVTWTADGVNRSATVDLGAGEPLTGQSVQLRVNGDRAVAADPIWLNIAGIVVGLVLIGAAFFVWRRSRRSAT